MQYDCEGLLCLQYQHLNNIYLSRHGIDEEPLRLWQNNYINLTTHFALYGDYYHLAVLDKWVKATCDVCSACAFVFQVNNLQIAADPFQPARVSNQGAQNGVAKQMFKDVGKTNLNTKEKTPNAIKKPTTKNPPASHHHTWGS